MEGLGDCLILFGLQSQNAMDSRELFLTVPETGSLRSGCQHGWVLVGTLLRVAGADFTLHPHTADSSQPSCDSYKGH